MRFSTSLIVFSLLVALGVSAYVFVNSAYYPIAFVNFRPITAGAYDEEFKAAFTYYSQALATYVPKEGEEPVDVEKLRRDLRVATLNDLIENALVEEELKSRVGKELPALVDKKLLSVNLDKKELPAAVKNLYGLSVEEFRRLVLIPQARREILASRLTEEQKVYETWIGEVKEKARVAILVEGIAWNGREAVSK